MKRYILIFTLLPSLLSAQFLNFSGSLGLGKIWESSQISNDFNLKDEIRPNRSPFLLFNYQLRTSLKFGRVVVTTGINNAVAGNSFGFFVKSPKFRSFGGLKKRLFIGRDFLQIPILFELVDRVKINFKEGQNHTLNYTLKLGFALNQMNEYTSVENFGSIYENEAGASDTLLFQYDYQYLGKTGVGIMTEIVFNRVKKKSGIPSTLFLKVMLHQGLTKLAHGRVDVTFNSIQDSFNFISRGSYAGVAIGFYIARNKVSYQKQHEFYSQLQFGS